MERAIQEAKASLCQRLHKPVRILLLSDFASLTPTTGLLSIRSFIVHEADRLRELARGLLARRVCLRPLGTSVILYCVSGNCCMVCA